MRIRSSSVVVLHLLAHTLILCAAWRPALFAAAQLHGRAAQRTSTHSRGVIMDISTKQPLCVLYLKGQSQGCWLPHADGEPPRENFDEYCEYVERIVHKHGVRRIIWVGGGPMSTHIHTFTNPHTCTTNNNHSPHTHCLQRGYKRDTFMCTQMVF